MILKPLIIFSSKPYLIVKRFHSGKPKIPKIIPPQSHNSPITPTPGTNTTETWTRLDTERKHTRSLNPGETEGEKVMRNVPTLGYAITSSQSQIQRATNHLGRSIGTFIERRWYSCFHGTILQQNKNQTISTKDTDLSGKHKLITETTCTLSNCEQENCADPNSNIVCPGRTAQKNQTSIPQIIYQSRLITKVVMLLGLLDYHHDNVELRLRRFSDLQNMVDILAEFSPVWDFASKS